MEHAVPIDWSNLARVLSSEFPGRFIPFSSYKRRDFEPSQRRQWLAVAANVPAPLPQVTELDGVLATIATNAIVRVQEAPRGLVIYGIHKKGMSLLTELCEISPLFRRYRIVDDSMSTAAIVRGRDVLIIDDSIHKGDTANDHIKRLVRERARTISLLTVVGCREGVKRALRQRVAVTTLVEAAEKEFTLVFGILIVPLLGMFRNGALSNRPYLTLRISRSPFRRSKAAHDVMAALVQCPMVSEFCEIPPVDGAKLPVFHGTLSIRGKELATLRRRMAKVSGLEQGKVRVFVSTFKDHVHLCLCSIIWPIGGRGVHWRPLERESDTEAARMLSQLTRELRRTPAIKGYRVTVGKDARRVSA